MRKILIVNLLLCSAICTAHADIGEELQDQNQSSILHNTNLWQRVRDGFALDHKETKEVKYWEKRYANQKYFNIIMQNAAPYLYFVLTELERRGMPSELVFIPIVESTYNPNAVSPAAISTGMWQFVSSSGKRFGLKQNSDLDERKDIIKSTRAAISYFIYLHDLFGSWELAIAAYNWGEGNIYNSVTKANSKDFYDLDVRDVTRQYVPKVIALANIIQNPNKFGIKLTDLNNNPYFVIINPKTPITVNNFMDINNMSDKQNKALNPQYNSTNYKVSINQRLLLPLSPNSSLANLNSANNNSDNKTASYISPTVTTLVVSSLTSAKTSESSSENDEIAQISADKYSSKVPINQAENKTHPTTNLTTINKDAEVNDLLSTNNEVKPSADTKSYIVANGDTLYSISKKFAVSLDDIKAANQLSDNALKPNQKLIIRKE